MMNKIQKSILDQLANKGILKGMTLRQLGNLVGANNAQGVKHHLLQLQKAGLIRLQREGKGYVVRSIQKNPSESDFKMIPILGSASCGEATQPAEECIDGYVQVARRMLGGKNVDFAIQAVGNSMNNARVNQESSIEDGDYVLIDKNVKQPKNGDYVLSVIDDVANIKKFFMDGENNQILLLSESKNPDEYPPIYLGQDIGDKYRVNGKVVGVLKKPNL